MSQSVSQSSGMEGGTLGTCPACFRSDIRITAGGLMYCHGSKGAHCVGVGKVPLAVTTTTDGDSSSAQSASSSQGVPPPHLPHLHSTTPSLSQDINNGAPTSAQIDSLDSLSQLFCSPHPTIKFIPRSARQVCVTSLTKLCTSIVNCPTSEINWISLLSFGRLILSKPTRGGVKKSLTNIISAKCKDLLSVGAQVLMNKCQFNVTAKTRRRGRGRGLSVADKEELRLGDMARGVATKLEEGNYKSAVRLLCSDETIASNSPETTQAIRDKHPPVPTDRRVPPALSAADQSIIAKESAVRQALLSFPESSSGGLDGLTAQHLRDMVTIEGDSSPLLSSLTRLINLIIGNGVPESVRPIIFGERLVALNKKGGIRPIAVGFTLRRLAAKVINSEIITKLSPVFAPTQIGVGVSGGVEAAVHAVRRYMQNLPSTHAIIKLDFKNAFNTIRRDAVLEASKIAIPEAYPFIYSGYASSSTLHLGSDIIHSSRRSVDVWRDDKGGRRVPSGFCIVCPSHLSMRVTGGRKRVPWTLV